MQLNPYIIHLYYVDLLHIIIIDVLSALCYVQFLLSFKFLDRS